VERIRGALSEHVRISRVDDERTFFPELLKQIDAARSSIHIWAPWIAGRVEHVLPSLEAARDREVDVVVFARGERDTLQAKVSMLAFLRQLQASRVTVVAIHMMHEKVVVIDRQLVMLGSLNSLSQRNTREVMVSVHGRHFAQRLFEELRAERFLKPRKCPTCGSMNGEFRRWKKGWIWWCIAVADGKRCAGRVPMNF
jgi:phosphatidylserine/phosphatidylglycerophosphate/cardiolipin synthase-like enzyme